MPRTLYHGDPLSPAQAAHLLTRAAAGEVLTHAPVKSGEGWTLAHLATLSAAQHREHARRVRLTADLLDGHPVPAALLA